MCARYVYASHKGRDALISSFLEPTEESLKLEAKLDSMGEGVKALVYPFLFSLPDAAEILPLALGMRQKQARRTPKEQATDLLQ